MPPRGIPQRRRIFLGCEGESERSYGALLGRIVELRHRRVHIDGVVLQPGAGDPLALVERAVEAMRHRANRNGIYAFRALILDSDKCGLSPDRDARIEGLARRHDLLLIWQEPCHEALLLRHLDGCAALRPGDSLRAADELRRRWPDYRKGLPAMQLAARLDEASVLRAAHGNPPLRTLLDAIEFGRD
ncbi:RloB domain-containing protein [Methylobacterium sp. A54F]